MRHSLLTSCVLAAMAALGLFALPQSAYARNMVSFSPSVQPGTIVISAHQRRLYLVVGNGVAISYPVAVPRRGKEWSGVAAIGAK